eukprot:14270205-Ditylum_brightwellii.AAC.1
MGSVEDGPAVEDGHVSGNDGNDGEDKAGEDGEDKLDKGKFVENKDSENKSGEKDYDEDGDLVTETATICQEYRRKNSPKNPGLENK